MREYVEPLIPGLSYSILPAWQHLVFEEDKVLLMTFCPDYTIASQSQVLDEL